MKDLAGNYIQFNKIEEIVFFLFIVMCGFTSGALIPLKTLFIGGIGLYMIYKKRIVIERSIILYVASFYFIGFLQQYYYNYSDIGNYTQTIIAGWIVSRMFGERFKYAYLKTMYWLCLISLPCFILMILFGVIINIDALNINNPNTPIYQGFFLWNVRADEIIRGRNCGPFWEPGAFAGYICIVFVLFFKDLNLLWNVYKKEVKILLIALFTTFSTQGYIVFFFICLLYYVSDRLSPKKLLSIAIILFISNLIAINVPFIGNKVQEQFMAASDIESKEGSQNLSRFTTAALDIYYIVKHPLLGNTTLPEIRYVDHPYVRGEAETLGGRGTGSGVTDFIATYGIIPFCIWFYYSCKNMKVSFGKNKMILCMLVLLMLGNAECYFLWIMYNTLPFIKY